VSKIENSDTLVTIEEEKRNSKKLRKKKEAHLYTILYKAKRKRNKREKKGK
jgi:hypothetical protein